MHIIWYIYERANKSSIDLVLFYVFTVILIYLEKYYKSINEEEKALVSL